MGKRKDKKRDERRNRGREAEISSVRPRGDRKRGETAERATYGYLYLYAGHGACQTGEGAAEREKERERGGERTEPRQGGDPRPFLCSIVFSLVLDSPANLRDASAAPFIRGIPRFNVCQRRLNLAALVSMLDTLSLLSPST